MLEAPKPHELLLIERRRRGWTQAQAADHFGVSGRTYFDVEKGSLHPGLQLAVAIENEFGIPASSWVASVAKPEETAA